MRYLWVISFLVGVVGACGKSGTDPEDSQTHWLAECRSTPECGKSLECVCGRCAKLCESAACDVAGRSVQCRAADSDASKALCAGGDSRAVCLEPCQSSATCTSGTACIAGSCLPVVAQGTGGAAATGGMAGASGGSSGEGATAQGGAATGGATSTGGSLSGGAGESAGGAAGGAGGVDCGCVLGAYVPVCGVDGQTYDAACGESCVPVKIACNGQCPCPAQCAADTASCANGETCCTGLMCCAGVPVPAGQEYCSAVCPRSDRALKRGFVSIDPNQVLERLAELPISRWSYKTEGSETLHLGPMAQDFKQAFGLGESDRTILQVDADGVAFAAIQALYLRLQATEAKEQALERELEHLKAVCEAPDPPGSSHF